MKSGVVCSANVPRAARSSLISLRRPPLTSAHALETNVVVDRPTPSIRRDIGLPNNAGPFAGVGFYQGPKGLGRAA